MPQLVAPPIGRGRSCTAPVRRSSSSAERPGIALPPTTRLATASGGKVLCQALVPLGAADFSSNLLKAQIVGLANADHDTTNAIKQSAEFGIIQHGRKLGASWSSLPMWPMLAGSAGFATHVGFVIAHLGGSASCRCCRASWCGGEMTVDAVTGGSIQALCDARHRPQHAEPRGEG
jgi:hypothetical protein